MLTRELHHPARIRVTEVQVRGHDDDRRAPVGGGRLVVAVGRAREDGAGQRNGGDGGHAGDHPALEHQRGHDRQRRGHRYIRRERNGGDQRVVVVEREHAEHGPDQPRRRERRG
jgi:hypothetical protein